MTTGLDRALWSKILLHRQLPNLGVELLGLPLGLCRLDRTGAEHMLGLRHQLLFPVLDLIRVHLELLGQIGQVRSPRTAANATVALKTGE